jgi:hypothetical protein
MSMMGLAASPGHRRRAYMLEHQDSIAEYRADALRLAREERGPSRAVVDQLDRSVMRPHGANVRRLNFFLPGHVVVLLEVFVRSIYTLTRSNAILRFERLLMEQAQRSRTLEIRQSNEASSRSVQIKASDAGFSQIFHLSPEETRERYFKNRGDGLREG